MTSRRAAELVALILAALVGTFAPAAVGATAVEMLSTTATKAAPYRYDGLAASRVDVYTPDGAAGAAPQLSSVREGSASTAAAAAQASTTPLARSNATNRLATGTDDAVFWSGIGRGGDATAASWAAKNGGATLESTMAQRGIQLPAWDASNPSVVSAWRQASADFASGASGNVRVLQGADVRIGSVWAEVEYPALVSNPNVTSITSINPATGEQVVLWTRP